MKQIIKSIISRPGRSVGLIIEVIIITIIGWIVIEPVAVKTTTALIPAGYDYDRLVYVPFSTFSGNSEKYDSLVPNDDEHRNAAYDRLLDMIRKRDGVEKATFSYSCSFEQGSMANNGMKADSVYYKDGEDNDAYITAIVYKPGTDFFATFGIKDVNGKPLVEPQNCDEHYIVSKSGAKALSAKGSVIGKKLFDWGDENDDNRTIIAITQDMPYGKGKGRNPVYFQPASIYEWYRPAGIAIRVGAGVNPHAFIDKLTADISDYRSGNTYITHPSVFSDMRDQTFSEQQRELTQNWIIVVFFLVNMLLGIAGTFYVQCKSRIPDAGVMRAFGATRNRIEWSIIAEACLVTFIGWLIGSVIYLIYLKYQGFPMDTDANRITRIIHPIWHDTKLGRYSVIGGIILLFLLVTSTLGAWLPARKVGRVQIVDSLRDE